MYREREPSQVLLDTFLAKILFSQHKFFLPKTLEETEVGSPKSEDGRQKFFELKNFLINFSLFLF